MNLYENFSPITKERIWFKFAPFHYRPDVWNRAARVFLAMETINRVETVVGMSAALPQPSGTLHNAWRSHKVVVLPRFDHLWRAVADAQAALLVAEGKRYFCNAGDAPPQLIAYRDDPASGWRPTAKNGFRGDREKVRHNDLFDSKPRATNAEGLVVSHEYVGAA